MFSPPPPPYSPFYATDGGQLKCVQLSYSWWSVKMCAVVLQYPAHLGFYSFDGCDINKVHGGFESNSCFLPSKGSHLLRYRSSTIYSSRVLTHVCSSTLNHCHNPSFLSCILMQHGYEIASRTYTHTHTHTNHVSCASILSFKEWL